MKATYLLIIALGYLLGSIPFAYIAGRWAKGIDIRTVGTKNMGTHNVMLEVGRAVGCAVGALDMGKGVLPVLAARWLGLPDWAVLSAGTAAVLGHNFPLSLGFHGGRGISTSGGVVLALMPKEALIALAVLGVLYFLVTHSISFSAIVSFILLSCLAWRWGRPPILILSPPTLLLTMGIKVLPEGFRLWKGAEDKGDLIFNRFIFNRKASINEQNRHRY